MAAALAAFVTGPLTPAAVSGQSQGQGRAYRGGADLVSVYVTVTDRAGRLVPDLVEADFEVRDNGKRQDLAVFSNAVQPLSVIVMLDRSGSMDEHADLVRDAASEFVRRLLPDDRARIGSLANDIRISPDAFTGSRPELLEVLRTDLQDIGPSPVWTALDRCITALSAESGRRVVLLFSDGYDQPERGQIVTEFDDVLHRARFNDVMVYTIGFPYIEYSPRMTALGARSITTVKKPHGSLKKLAEETGGGYFELEPADPLGPTFIRVAEELHRQYWLGFKPPALDDEVHKIEVKVKRPGVSVRARKTYVAAAIR